MANSIVDMSDQSFLGQDDFSGGMNCLNPGANQCIEIRNATIRNDGKITTRPGMRSYFKIDDGGYLIGFYFNQENWKISDASHTGFWFDFDFVRSAVVTKIQGIAIIRLSIHDKNKTLFAADGYCYLYEDGYVTNILCTPEITTGETINFVQAVDRVWMYRGEDLTPMVWDGTTAGFIEVAAPITGSPTKNSTNGLYHAGRMWLTNGDDVYASDILDPTTYDYVWANWSCWKQQGQQGVTLHPFHESGILCFKKDKVSLLDGVNSQVLTGTHFTDYVRQLTVDEHSGCIAPNAIVTVGEDVWYLGYSGIYSLLRNQQNKVQIESVTVSCQVQNYIDRINWGYAHTSCAMTHSNYIIFGVPIDGATTPNVCLVYDKLLDAWAGVWDGALMNPTKFLKDNEVPLFLTSNFVMRRMFTTDPWDSENPFVDTPAWSATKTYQGLGELVYFEFNGDKIYRSIQTSLNQSPPDATYWEVIPDVKDLYQIETYVKTRQYKWMPVNPPIRFSRADLLFRHRNPCITLSMNSRDHSTIKALFTDVVYSQEEYDVANTPDWDPTNVNLDFNDPYRKDYTLLLGAGGIWIDSSGIYTGIWETHSLKFIPVVVSLQSIGLEITNTQGMIEIDAVRLLCAPRRFGMQKVL